MSEQPSSKEHTCDRCGGAWHGGTPCMPFHRESLTSNEHFDALLAIADRLAGDVKHFAPTRHTDLIDANTIRDAVNAIRGSAVPPVDDQCICKGNWRTILKESEPLLGTWFEDRNGKHFRLFGIVDSGEDYYYGMWNPESGMILLSCVGSIATHGYTSVTKEDSPLPDETRAATSRGAHSTEDAGRPGPSNECETLLNEFEHACRVADRNADKYTTQELRETRAAVLEMMRRAGEKDSAL